MDSKTKKKINKKKFSKKKINTNINKLKIAKNIIENYEKLNYIN